jgi:hypothetical protein
MGKSMDEDLNGEWKIVPVYEVFYIECIRIASLAAINSWERLNEIVSSETLLKSDGLDLIDLAENIINQAAILSKYFYPPRSQGSKNVIHRLRGEKLRSSYLIDDSNPLKDRTFRDFIEHFDEKLDEFLNGTVAGNIIPPKRLFWKSEDISEVTFLFKAFIVSEFKYISLSREIYLPPLMEEVYRIYNLSLDYLHNGGRLR